MKIKSLDLSREARKKIVFELFIINWPCVIVLIHDVVEVKDSVHESRPSSQHHDGVAIIEYHFEPGIDRSICI